MGLDNNIKYWARGKTQYYCLFIMYYLLETNDKLESHCQQELKIISKNTRLNSYRFFFPTKIWILENQICFFCWDYLHFKKNNIMIRLMINQMKWQLFQCWFRLWTDRWRILDHKRRTIFFFDWINYDPFDDDNNSKYTTRIRTNNKLQSCFFFLRKNTRTKIFTKKFA